MIKIKANFTFILALCIFCGFASAQTNTTMLTALVNQTEADNGLPKPVLLNMLDQGVNLEDAARIAVGSSKSSEYAEAYTYYAICMAVSVNQAQEIHDIVIASAINSLRPNVVVEAHYTLDHYEANRCDGIELSTRIAPTDNTSTENTAATRASLSQ